MTRKIRPLARAPYQANQGCGGKRRYNSARIAEQVKEEQELLNPGLKLRVYKCTIPGCGSWHLTRTEETWEP